MQPFPGSVKGIAWGNNQAKLIYNRTMWIPIALYTYGLNRKEKP